jgi:anaerobic magnesium-protoporphyrin IX monomethyl ester cyclase
MPRVALVYPYFRTKSPTEMLFPPLGLALLASQLHRLGVESKIFDCTFDTFETIQNKLESYHPDIVGIYTMVTLSHNTFRIAEMVRTILPESLLVAGGPLPTLYPEQYSIVFDAVFRGEADLSFPAFCSDLFAQKSARPQLKELVLNKYPGLFIRRDILQVENPLIHYREKELDTFPLPYRGDFDHPAYQEVWFQQEGTKTTSLITTLGCPFNVEISMRFSRKFNRSAAWAMTACGSLTITLPWIPGSSGNSANASQVRGSGGAAFRA